MPRTQKTRDDHEGRIVRLETGLQQVSDTVEKLAGVVHEQSNDIREQSAIVERELKALAVAITQAAAPRKTDWHLVVNVIGVALAIGALVFIPLNMQLRHESERCLERHNHVSDGLVNVRGILQRESELINADIKAQVAAIKSATDREVQNLGDRLVGRMNDFEKARDARDEKDVEELRQWRMSGMGLKKQQ